MLRLTKYFLFLLILIASFSFGNIVTAENENIASTGKIRVIYFYAEDCPSCAQIKPFIEKIKTQYQDKIDFLEHNVKEKEECRQLFFEFIKTYNLPLEKAKVPLIFVGKDYLLGTSEIENNLESKIEEKIARDEELLLDCHKFLEEWAKRGGTLTDINLGSCNAQDTQNFCSIPPLSSDNKKTISIGLIISTAAIDSINPCAIAVLLFLLAILVSLKVSRKRMLAIGAVYIFAVFISYYLAGLGILNTISHFGISRQINIFAAIVVIIAAFISIKEGLMPESRQLLVIPEKIKGVLLKFLKKTTFPAVFLAGILVSAFELPCTGQVYLAILSLLSQENLSTQGYFYLLIYNFVFVLPLIIILLAAAWGLNIDKLQKLRQETKKSIKVSIGIVMLVLGIWLIYTTL